MPPSWTCWSAQQHRCCWRLLQTTTVKVAEGIDAILLPLMAFRHCCWLLRRLRLLRPLRLLGLLLMLLLLLLPVRLLLGGIDAIRLPIAIR